MSKGTNNPPGRALQQARDFVHGRSGRAPKIGVVLGSGLGGWARSMARAESLAYAEIPTMPRVGVAGHDGKLWHGEVAGRAVACLQGRVHAYEGHPTEHVVFGVRLLAALGCEVVLLTNAAGGIRADLQPGSLMLVSDHLNLTGMNPLVGWEAEGSPFVDLSDAYATPVQEAAKRAAHGEGITLAEGVYAGLLGPSYETPSEIRMLRTLGADAVGMSTVLETIALVAAGVRVGAVSCITNAAAGCRGAILDHEDVQRQAEQASEQFRRLLDHWVAEAPL